ncbi:MAG: hypothetical protein WDZ31_06835 [Phycisphaeraceae bacterium]
MTRRRPQLGMVVDDHALRVADAAGHVVEWPLDAKAWPEAAATGAALRRAMEEAGVRGQAVMVGVPGRWLAVRPRTMPPAEGAALAGAVRLAAEREFPGQADRLVIDYTPEATTAEAPDVLLCALPADRLAWLRGVAEAAKLRLLGVTPAAVAGGAGRTGGGGADGLTLHLAPGRCELSVSRDGQLHLLRHLGGSLNGVARHDGDGDEPHDLDAATRSLTAEVRRTLAMLDRPAESVHIDDAIGLDPAVLTRIGEQLSLTVRRADPAAATAATVAPRFAPAARLATLDPDALEIDFTAARTQRKPRRQLSRAARVGLLAGLLVVLVVGWYVLDIVTLHRELADHANWQAQRRVQIDRATMLRDDLRTARGWLDDRPGHLDALLALTTAFPERGDVWATNVTLDAAGVGVLTGRGRNERDVLDLLDRLQQVRAEAPAAGGAKLVYVREADARTGEVAFAINLTPRQEDR